MPLKNIEETQKFDASLNDLSIAKDMKNAILQIL